MVFWFTGLSGSGKTTLATFLAEQLRSSGFPAILLDGDMVRQNLCSGLGFSMADREENIRRIASCAALAENSGLVVCVACISPLAKHRNMARGIVRQYHEIYVSCPVEICSLRDPKGLYKEAEQGSRKNFTGISSAYEVPVHYDLKLDTCHDNFDISASKVLEYAKIILISGKEKSCGDKVNEK